MALQTYALANVLVNGALLAEHGSVSVNRATNSQAVNTVSKGYAGESPGAANCTISIKNAVPAADFELNPGAFMKALNVVEVTVFVAGRTLTSKGFVIGDAFAHSVNAEATLDISFRGEFADWT